MALEFSKIPDRNGPAVYLLGSRMHETDLKRKGDEIDAALPEDVQVVYLDADSGDGARTADFYDILRERLPIIMIVNDDDTIHMTWEGASIPGADQIAYEVSRITGSLRA